MGSGLLITAVVTSFLTSAVALSLAKVSQGSIHSVKATQLATQSEQYALGQAAILKATNYDDLAAQSRQVIQNSNGYEYAVSLSGETELSTGVKQRLATVRVYRTGEALPRATLVVPKTDVEVQASGGVPIGTIIAWASNTAPTEGGTWLLCNGQSCSAYPKLVALIGSTVPSLNGRFLEGTTSTNVRNTKSAGLPNIYGKLDSGSDNIGLLSATGVTTSGAFKASVHKKRRDGAAGSTFNPQIIEFNASWYNSIYGASSTVQPPSYLVKYYIKAA